MRQIARLGMMGAAALCVAVAASAQPVAETKAQASEPMPRDVPELMVTKAGEKVTDVATWEKVRRPELLDVFLERAILSSGLSG